MPYHQIETTNATDATNATNASSGAAAPVGSPGPGIAEQARDGLLEGLNVAAQMAGDIVRSVVPESVLDSIPFLLVDVIGGLA